MAHPETTPTKRGSNDNSDTHHAKMPSNRQESRERHPRRLPLSPTSRNTGGTPPGAQTARESTRRLDIVDNDGDDSDYEESEDEKPTASKGKKRKNPTSSKGKKPSNIRHAYRSVDPRYDDMTTERLFDEGHIATGSFSYNHLRFAEEAADFNDVKVKGKPVWQKQPSGPSTLHNSIVLTDHFPSLAPFLGPLEKLCKPRPSTTRLLLKQRAQQYTKSGRRHQDGKNGPWRICATIHNPAAPPRTKLLEIGVAGASKAKGGSAVNPFQTKPDGKPDAVQFDCPSGSYHLMDKVATGTVSHAHHQAVIDKTLLPVHGALTTFVVDLDPINPDTFIEDVARVAQKTADVVEAGIGVSAHVPPPTPEQIGQSCGSTQTSDWNRIQKAENLENYTQDRRDGGAQNKPSGKQTKPNGNTRGPGAAGKKEFDYTPYRRSIGHHRRGYKSEKGGLVNSEETSEFFEYRIANVKKEAWTLGTHPFDTHGDNTTQCYPYGVDGTRIETNAKNQLGNVYLMLLARRHANVPQG